MLFRHHFFQPSLLLRHHQEQMKLHQQQMLSQWLQKEDQKKDNQESLLKDGTCQWPGCEQNQFASKATFQHHLNTEHSLSQCSAAQVGILIQIYKKHLVYCASGTILFYIGPVHLCIRYQTSA